MSDSIYYFVKPHPPRDILRRRCPVPEKYRYDWEPVVLKYLAFMLKQSLPGANVRVWHLMDEWDDRAFLRAVAAEKPRAVFFTEIDVLVNEVNRLSGRIKAVSPVTVTAVGGKQTSLLGPGDRWPFRHIDFAVAGDGVAAVLEIAGGRAQPDGSRFIARDAKTGLVSAAPHNPRDKALLDLDPAFRLIPVVNHSFDEYLASRQAMPALTGTATRTAPLLIGTGCPYRCVFCQAPRDFGPDDAGYLLRDPALVAEEMALLRREWGVTHFFSLESNMQLAHLEKIYSELEKRGIAACPVSGFVRSGDLLAAHASGLLPGLVRRGLRFVHTGIDVVLGGKTDVYRKGDSIDDIRRSLAVCRESGLIVIGTYVGNPTSGPDEFRAELEELAGLDIADIDIRLAVALRRTDYFKEVEAHLVGHPDRNKRFFDRQNYRYQTILFPGKIAPQQTYAIVRDFLRRFPAAPARLRYAADMARRFPETRPYFEARFGSAALG
jgi:radical SAM superfamily enzyme YgiQ (UPF0313 family)